MRLRPCNPSDEADLAEVWIESWRSTGLVRPIVTEADLRARIPEELARRWTVTIAEKEERIIGFLALALEERRLDQLFIRPGAQGLGVGTALFGVAMTKLRHGFWLRTQAKNERARRFYEHMGMRLDRIEKDDDVERVIYVVDP